MSKSLASLKQQRARDEEEAHKIEEWNRNRDDCDTDINNSLKDQKTKAKLEKVGVRRNRYKLDPKTLKPVDWLINGFMTTDFCQIAGAAGVGKTTAIVPLCLYIAGLIQIDALPKVTHPRKVIYYTEQPGQVEDLLYGIQRKYGEIDPEKLNDWFVVSMSVRDEVEIVAEAMKLDCQDHSVVYDVGRDGVDTRVTLKPLTVYDTRSSNIAQENENDNTEASAIVASLKEVSNSLKCPVWIITHIAKAAKGLTEVRFLSARGAGAFEADVNMTAYLTHDESLGLRYLTLGKRRFNPRIFELSIDCEFLEGAAAPNDFGEVEQRFYAIPDIQESSDEVREQMKEVAAKKRIEAAESAIKRLIEKNRLEGTFTIKSDAIAMITGAKAKRLEIFNEMVSIEEIEIPSELTAKRKHSGRMLINKGSEDLWVF